MSWLVVGGLVFCFVMDGCFGWWCCFCVVVSGCCFCIVVSGCWFFCCWFFIDSYDCVIGDGCVVDCVWVVFSFVGGEEVECLVVVGVEMCLCCEVYVFVFV